MPSRVLGKAIHREVSHGAHSGGSVGRGPQKSGAGGATETLQENQEAKPSSIPYKQVESQRLQNLPGELAKLEFHPDPSFPYVQLPFLTTRSARSRLRLSMTLAAQG